MKNITKVIALNNGFFPHAAPLICDDLTGPLSLLGESALIPRPTSTVKLQRNKEAPALDDGHSVVLWDAAQPAANANLSCAASTFLAGSVTSTFDVAWQLMEQNALPEWGSVIAVTQTQGRGQLRRQWHSPRGNLYATFRVPKDENLQGNTAAVVLGYLLVSSFASLGFSLALKWPNDLMNLQNAKVGGILLEERSGVLLAGLGVNITEAPPRNLLREDHAIPAAVLFHDAEGPGDEPLAPFSLWRSLVQQCIMEYTHKVAGQSLERILAGAASALAWKNLPVTVVEGGECLHKGICTGLGPNGGLLLRTNSNPSLEVFSGSVHPA